MRYILLYTLSVLPLFSQVLTITQGPYLGTSTISRSSASVAWATNIPADTRIYWSAVSSASVTPSSCAAPACNLSTPVYPAVGGGPIQVHNWYTFGTPGGVTIYYQVCSMADSVQTCSETNNYTSGPATTTPANPIAPAPVDAPQVPTGTVHTVGSNCDDPSTGLVAMWTAAARGDVVEIDPTITPYCSGAYTFPAKPAGPPYILTRVKNAGATFPSYRRANLSDLPTQAGFTAGTNKMARFIDSAPNVYQLGSSDTSTAQCFAGDWNWRSGQSNAWADRKSTR